jgi:hypothetical protein
MCHDLEWQDWELLRDEERREDEQQRAIEVVEREVDDAETESDRELVHV